MAYVITDNCIKDDLCLEACPNDSIHPRKDEAGYEAATQLYIDPNECIDCGVCEPECPAEAILPDTENGLEQWLELNAQYSAEWPNITTKHETPADADEYKGVEGKFEKFFSPDPGQGD